MPVSVEYSRQASFLSRISAGMMEVGKIDCICMPLDDKVEKMNGGVYGVLKVLLGKAGNNIAGAVNYRRIETYWEESSL